VVVCHDNVGIYFAVVLSRNSLTFIELAQKLDYLFVTNIKRVHSKEEESL